jgi:hypothetical protein
MIIAASITPLFLALSAVWYRTFVVPNYPASTRFDVAFGGAI